MSWIYEGKEIHTHDDLLPECTDFVYVITYTSGQKYIGMKRIKSIRSKPPLKGKKRKRKILTNHPFVNYEGSSELTEGLEVECKEIFYQCSTKKAATYLELALIFHYNALFNDDYINKNASGKFFDNDLNGLLE